MTERDIENLRRSYDRDAVRRDTSVIEDWKRKERDTFFSLLRKEGNRTLLDVGSGPGRDGRYFKDNGIDVTCIDLSPENVRLCREKGLDARVMDLFVLDFPAESFDAVYAMNSLLHVPKAELPGVLESIRSVIKPNGLFYFGVYGGRDHEGFFEGDWTEPKRCFYFYTDEGICEVASRFFTLVSFKTISPVDHTDTVFQSLILRKRKRVEESA